jgi:hypothetical protein
MGNLPSFARNLGRNSLLSIKIHNGIFLKLLFNLLKAIRLKNISKISSKKRNGKYGT